MFGNLRSRVRALRAESYAIFLAARDPRTPWAARGILLLVAAYAVSPVDLIPDFIPVLGYLDDLIIVPAGIRLAIGLIPPEVMADARETAKNKGTERSIEMIGAGIIFFIWLLTIIVLALFGLRFFMEKK